MRKEEIGFNPELERGYLSRLRDEAKMRVLAREVETAVGEAKGQVRFSGEYAWRQGRIFDALSGEYLREVVARGGREEEEVAMIKIEGLLSEEKGLAVHFSPASEKYGYVDNVVDFWKREGERVWWQRVVVDEDWQGMKVFYQALEGEARIKGPMDLLANPVGARRFTAGGLLSWMEVKKCVGCDFALAKIVREIMERFVYEYGARMFEDSALILRVYSAAMAEAERLLRGEGEEFEEGWLPALRWEEYLWAPMRMVKVQGGGCAGVNLVARFEDRGMVVEKLAGELVIRPGSIEGKRYCSKCGCYYSGDKCPLCG